MFRLMMVDNNCSSIILDNNLSDYITNYDPYITYEDTDCQGNDIKSYSDVTIDNCKTYCTENKSCYGFNLPSGSDKPYTCYLKSNTCKNDISYNKIIWRRKESLWARTYFLYSNSYIIMID